MYLVHLFWKGVMTQWDKETKFFVRNFAILYLKVFPVSLSLFFLAIIFHMYFVNNQGRTNPYMCRDRRSYIRTEVAALAITAG